MRFFLSVLFIAIIQLFSGKKNLALKKEDFNLVTFKKDTFNALNDSYKKSFIIFANDYSCNTCFKTINNYLAAGNYDSTTTEVMVVGRVGTYLQNKRSMLNQFAILMPIVKKFFFDTQAENDPFPPLNIQEGLFGKLGITKTPCILIWNNVRGKMESFLYYKEVINSEGELSEKAISAIRKSQKGL
jgi:hypothetical protein